MSSKVEMVSDLHSISGFSLDGGSELDLRCCSCYTYLNKICERCSQVWREPIQAMCAL